MRYEAKMWLNKRQYLAILEKALVIVTVDDKGEPVRYATFGEKGEKGETICKDTSH